MEQQCAKIQCVPVSSFSALSVEPLNGALVARESLDGARWSFSALSVEPLNGA